MPPLGPDAGGRASRPSLTERMVRESLAAIRAWAPTWRPRHRMRAAVATLALGVAVLIVAWTAPRPVADLYRRFQRSLAAVTKVASIERLPAADKAVDVRLGRSTVAGAILYLPPTFRSTDGTYDLVVHFHGNVGLVEESIALADINAAVVIVNVGLGSGVYDQRFSGPAVLPAVLDRVDEEIGRRGLPSPHRRRVALTAWSAGYGAVVRILESGALGDSLDAIVLLDGFHAAFDQKQQVDLARLTPFVEFAHMAMRGERLLSITHSEIDPYTYPSSTRTTDALLGQLGLPRTPGGARPVLPPFSQMHGVPKDKLLPLEPTSECHSGSFHVRGFTGQTPEAHMAHLIYMATLALPELAQRWNATTAAAHQP